MRFTCAMLLFALLSCSKVPERRFIIQKFETLSNRQVRDVYHIDDGFICIIDDGVLFLNKNYQFDTSKTYQPPFEFSYSYIMNDSLYLVRDISDDSSAHYTFNGTNWKIAERPKSSTLYEDEYFETAACCDGEWGGSVFFIEKGTSRYYSSALSCVQSIVRLRDCYYVISTSSHMGYFTSVNKISDPSKMYELQEEKLDCQWWTMAFDSDDWVPKEALVGTERILDTLDLFINHSFVIKDTIYFLADYRSIEKDGFSFVGSLRNEELILIDTLSAHSIWSRNPTIQTTKRGTVYSVNNNAEWEGIVYLKGDTIDFVTFLPLQ